MKHPDQFTERLAEFRQQLIAFMEAEKARRPDLDQAQLAINWLLQKLAAQSCMIEEIARHVRMPTMRN